MRPHLAFLIAETVQARWRQDEKHGRCGNGDPQRRACPLAKHPLFQAVQDCHGFTTEASCTGETGSTELRGRGCSPAEIWDALAPISRAVTVLRA